MLRKQEPVTTTNSLGWDAYPAVLARIRAPIFPDRQFVISDFGAAVGNADDTRAIQQAIDACHAAGGGRVVIPAGVYATGALRLKSNVNLHVSEGATLRFLPDPQKYPLVHTRWEGVECMNYSPLIYAFEQENLAITGSGVIDGGASDSSWWGWRLPEPLHRPAKAKLIALGEAGVPVEQRVFGHGYYLRPNFIQPYRCHNVLIEGITLKNSPMWQIHPVLCTNVTVRGVHAVSLGPNNDGCDPESCRDVLIENCTFDTGDDCVAIKSGRNGEGRRIGVPSENIVVRGCRMHDGHGGVVIGSEISGGCRNVFIEDCRMDSINLDRALRIKSNAMRGGVVENVFMRHVSIGQVGEAVLTIDFLYEEGEVGPHPPTVRNVQLDHVTSLASPRVMYIAGFPGAVIDGIRFSDCVFSGITAAEVLDYAASVEFRNVRLEPKTKPGSLHRI
jgi:polygalacturonase